MPSRKCEIILFDFIYKIDMVSDKIYLKRMRTDYREQA